MAANLTFKFLVDDKGLKKGVNNAKNQLTGFEKATKKAGDGIKKALGGLGIGLGLAAIVSGLKDATKAAIEDNKSQAILAQTLRNVTGASDEQIASVEKRISAMQTELAITDDQLRPAYASLVNVLGDTDTAMTALALAADVSAGTGKDLQSVAASLSKAYAGNFTALNKLVPATKNAANPIAKLQELYAGMAKTAANTDPYKRLEIIFGEISEQIGNQVLPLLQQFSAYLASPEGQEALYNIVNLIIEMVKGLSEGVTWIGNNADALKALVTGWAAVLLAINAAKIAMGVYTIATGAAQIATANLGKIMKKSGWLTLILLAAQFIPTDALTGDTNFDVTTPQSIMPTNTGTLTPEQQMYYNQQRLAALMAEIKAPTNKPLNAAINATLERMKNAAKKMQEYGKSFRDSVDLAFGLNDTGTRFSAERFIRQLNRAVEAAKKMPGLIKQIRESRVAGSTALANELSAMNPLQGSVIAEGLLSSGKLAEIGSLRNQLTVAGMQTALAGAGSASYTININKANMSATEIIAAIQKYERSTGRKVLLGNG